MNPLYRRARFLVAAAHPRQFPSDEGLEVVFAGRSNAGKSSAINRLCGQKSLARTSKTPGRTQQIVFFDLDGHRRLVDLPGYGYAKVPEREKRHWGQLIEGYLQRRRALRGVVLVMDIRHPLKPFDVQMLEWCAAMDLPALVLLSKADKLKHGAQLRARQTVLQAAADLQVAAEVVPFSATKGSGTEPAWRWLDRRLEVETTKTQAKKCPGTEGGEESGA